MKKIIYLDNNATTALDCEVLAAMNREFAAPPHNPSSIHSLGQEAKKILTESRELIANFLGVAPSEIFFTSGGTESMNLLIQGLFSACHAHIIGSLTDHASIYQPLLALQKGGAEVTFLSYPTTHAVEKALRSNTHLIVLSAINSETGDIFDIEEIAKVAQFSHIPLIIDSVALLGKGACNIPKGVVGMGFSSHKIHGPPGAGFIFLRQGITLSPIFHGGGQERTLRSGTENLPAIVGMAKAISLIKKKHYKTMDDLRQFFESRLKELLPTIEVNNVGKRISNTSNIYFPKVDNESLIIALDREGVIASGGAACSSGATTPSRVLVAMGFSKERARCSVRFSLSRMNTPEEVEKATEVIAGCVQRLEGVCSKNEEC